MARGRLHRGRLDAVLNGSASDSRVTWATDRSTGVRLDLIWPVGYRARFSPRLEILDQGGAVVGHGGDLIIGGCRDAAAGGAFRVEGSDVRPPTWQPGDG